MMCFLRCFLLCFLRCFLRCFCVTVWRIVGRGENPVGPGTSVSGGVNQDKECALKLSWPSTAEYRMMKLKKKKKGTADKDLDKIK